MHLPTASNSPTPGTTGTAKLSKVVEFGDGLTRRNVGRRPATRPAPKPEPDPSLKANPTPKPDPTLMCWVESCVHRDHLGHIRARDGYRAYCLWTQHVGVKAVTETAWGRFLSQHIVALGGSKSRRKGGAIYSGVKLVPMPNAPAVRMAA